MRADIYVFCTNNCFLYFPVGWVVPWVSCYSQMSTNVAQLLYCTMNTVHDDYIIIDYVLCVENQSTLNIIFQRVLMSYQQRFSINHMSISCSILYQMIQGSCCHYTHEMVIWSVTKCKHKLYKTTKWILCDIIVWAHRLVSKYVLI